MSEMKDLQLAFFKKIKHKIDPQLLMAKEIARVLHISTSETYNKTKLENHFTITMENQF